ncbi:small nuclear ribonucleoprotein Sm D3b-like protein [Tanacetum coccineum]|uniref:Small nuclear ribonucleoprotein Sm D3b-like protein n=1 Tax=Tanacetum coccineum TaxID=301880 RepID=A0ABQ5C0T9_9ASTR
MSRSLGIPVKLLHESAGHIVTVELKSGEVYRGSLVECEDNWNSQIENVTFTAKAQAAGRGAAAGSGRGRTTGPSPFIVVYGLNPKTPLDLTVLDTSGIMPTKIKLTLEQSQQGVSDDVLKVVMELAKRTVEVKKYESVRKMTTSLVERRDVAMAQRVERKEPVTAQGYSLRSSSKENKKPPLAMSFERSMDAVTVERKTIVRRTARKGY